MAAAFKFEEAIQAGYDIDKVKRFCDYADYVLDLKERNGLAPTTIERYRAMLPRINDAIGHLKLTQIRPQHLNDFYKTLSESGCHRCGEEGVEEKSGGTGSAKACYRKRIRHCPHHLECSIKWQGREAGNGTGHCGCTGILGVRNVYGIRPEEAPVQQNHSGTSPPDLHDSGAGR